MKLMKELGFFNVIFEIDLGDTIWDFKKYPIEKFIHLLQVHEKEKEKSRNRMSVAMGLEAYGVRGVWG